MIIVIFKAVNYLDNLIIKKVESLEEERNKELEEKRKELDSKEKKEETSEEAKDKTEEDQLAFLSEAGVEDSVSLEENESIYQKYKEKLNRWVQPRIYLLLGHYQLLLEYYEEALSAYLEFEKRVEEAWRDTTFLYGVGLCYFHYNAFHK